MKTTKKENVIRGLPPAKSDELNTNRLVNLAMRLVEQRLLDGTATSQETTHFLRIGSDKEKYEIEKLKSDLELAHAKIEQMKKADEIEARYQEAIDAMRRYSGDDHDSYNKEDIYFIEEE